MNEDNDDDLSRTEGNSHNASPLKVSLVPKASPNKIASLFCCNSI